VHGHRGQSIRSVSTPAGEVRLSGSSNGRTLAFDSSNAGSIPAPGATGAHPRAHDFERATIGAPFFENSMPITLPPDRPSVAMSARGGHSKRNGHTYVHIVGSPPRACSFQCSLMVRRPAVNRHNGGSSPPAGAIPTPSFGSPKEGVGTDSGRELVE
jgi:hypothetical protein